MIEEWRDIPGYNGKYQASSEGRIRNAQTGKTLTSNVPSQEYAQVGLTINGTTKRHSIHRLIALTFFGSPPLDKQGQTYVVNHKNGNKRDNRLINLEYVSSWENTRHYHTFLKGDRIVKNKIVIRMDRSGIWDWICDEDCLTDEDLGNLEEAYEKKVISEIAKIYPDAHIVIHEVGNNARTRINTYGNLDVEQVKNDVFRILLEFGDSIAELETAYLSGSVTVPNKPG